MMYMFYLLNCWNLVLLKILIEFNFGRLLGGGVVGIMFWWVMFFCLVWNDVVMLNMVFLCWIVLICLV